MPRRAFILRPNPIETPTEIEATQPRRHIPQDVSDGLPHCPDPENDDAALLRLYADTRSEAAFATFVRRYVDLVYSTAVRCVAGDVHLARDVTQEVFVAVARRAAALASHRAPEGWLYTTTRYEAAHAVRCEQRRRAREQKAHLMNELHPDSTPEPEWQQLHPLLDDAMGTLSERDRDAVVMRFFLHRSFRDISARLGLNEDAARRRVDRALEKLHQVLAQRGVTSTAAAIGGLLSTQAVGAAPAGLAEFVSRAAVGVSSGAASMTWGPSLAKFAAGIAGVALLVSCLSVASREIRARRAAEEALAVAEQDAVSRLAAQRDLEQRVLAAELDLAGLGQTTAPAFATTSTRAAKPPPADSQTFLAQPPDVRQAIIERSNAKLRYRWGVLFQALGLNPQQIARFQSLVRESETYQAGAGPDGQPVSFPLGTGLPRSEVEAQLRDLLGDDGVRRFREFAATIPARELIVPLAGALHHTATPLTAEQAERLAQILTQNRAKSRSVQTSKFDWNAVMAAAPTVLSSPQLAALDGMRAQDLIQTILGARLTEAMPRPDGTSVPSK